MDGMKTRAGNPELAPLEASTASPKVSLLVPASQGGGRRPSLFQGCWLSTTSGPAWSLSWTPVPTGPGLRATQDGTLQAEPPLLPQPSRAGWGQNARARPPPCARPRPGRGWSSRRPPPPSSAGTGPGPHGGRAPLSSWACGSGRGEAGMARTRSGRPFASWTRTAGADQRGRVAARADPAGREAERPGGGRGDPGRGTTRSWWARWSPSEAGEQPPCLLRPQAARTQLSALTCLSFSLPTSLPPPPPG